MSVSDDIDGETVGASAPKVLAYRFAEFRLLASSQRLEVGNQTIALTTKLYHLLLTFLTHPDEVLSKDAIAKAVWPGQVVTDTTLAKQVERLRSTLGDNDRDPPLIETHRGRGYRLTCSVTRELQTTTPNDLSVVKPARQRMQLIGSLTLGSALVIALALSFQLKQEDNQAAMRKPIAVVPITDLTTALSEGAAEYLLTQLGDAADLAPALTNSGTSDRATDLNSLQLYRVSNRPVAALRLTKQNDVYQLNLSFRNAQGNTSTVLENSSIYQLLQQGNQWLSDTTGSVSTAPATPPTDNAYALASYFEGLQVTGCDRAVKFYRAALARDPDFYHARLRLARCEYSRGNAHEAAATAVGLITEAERSGESALELGARLVAARAYLTLGDGAAAKAQLETASALTTNTVRPLQRLDALSVLALLANLEGNTDRAQVFNEQRLAIAKSEYPMPAYLAEINLDLADFAIARGDYAAMLDYASTARALAEEHGNPDMLIASYRFLITNYFRVNDMSAAVQLALAARPLMPSTEATNPKGFFMQFAALALNLRGYLSEAREYTAQLRELESATANPMYGALADFTVMHRLYTQGDFARAYTSAATTRARLQQQNRNHIALPQALAFEAVAAARGAPVAVAQALIEDLEKRSSGAAEITGPLHRAKGHVLARVNRADEALHQLRAAEAIYRSIGGSGVADYVGYELIELRLAHEARAPWDDLERLIGDDGANYQLLRLQAQAYARDRNFLAATTAMEEARLRGNELWSDEDQLQLEKHRSTLATAQAEGPKGRQAP